MQTSAAFERTIDMRTKQSFYFISRASDEGGIADVCCEAKHPQFVNRVIPPCLTIAGFEDNSLGPWDFQKDLRNCESAEMARSMSFGDAYSSGL